MPGNPDGGDTTSTLRLVAAGLLVIVSLTCPYRAAAGPQGPVAGDRPPTFARDVAPILFRHCAVCHHDGGLAPFSLVTYEDIRPRARAIRQATASRYMPPWKPAPGYGGPFAGERRLSDADIALIGRWVDEGAVEGDAAHLPPAPAWPAGWHLGPPDLVVTLPEPYDLPAGAPDEYRNFALPVPVETVRFVRGFEFRPRSPAVHHARILLDRSGAARRLERDDPEPGYDDRLGDDAEFPEGHLLAWAPGKIPAFEPDELAWRLDPGADLVLQLHLPAVDVPARIQPEIGLYFSAAPATRAPAIVLLGDKTIDIPPGAGRHVIEDAYRLPVDAEVLSVYPHAHYLGKELEAFATLPDGSRRELIRIADWDFNWQDEYRFVEPVPLPAGTLVEMRYFYDNSAANRSNPSHPPRRVRYGRRSTDEMAELVIKLRTRTAEDQDLLARDFAVKANQVDIAGAEKRARDAPRDFRAHHELGLYYLEAGRIEEATDRFEQVLRLRPGFAPAHYNLGIIQGAQGRLGAAEARFRQALAHDSEHVAAHTNLGVVLHALDRPEEAVTHYRRAVALEPDIPEAHNNLAVVLRSLGRVGEALASYHRVLELNPDDAEVLNALAWLLATHPDAGIRDPEEAIRLGERAAGLTSGADVVVLDTLAAAYAAAGRFDPAVATVEAALAALPAAAPPEVAAGLRARRELYTRRQPFRQPAP